MPARRSSRMPADRADTGSGGGESPRKPIAAGLLQAFGKVLDPRKRRGRRFGVASILLVALAATLAGARTFVAIGEWASDAPPEVLARLGIDRAAPSEKAIRMLLQLLDADAFDAALGAWMWLRTSVIDGRRVISFDGKTLKGARDAAGALTHLLAGLCQKTGAVVAQIGVPGKTSEVPKLRELVKTLDLAGAVLTADALHTCRETAQLIVDSGAHFIFTIKSNQPLLLARVKALPWKKVPVLDRVKGKPAHGRVETRTFKATAVDGSAGGLDFPGAVQVLQIKRTRVHRKTGKKTTETVYAVTSLSAADADHRQVAEWLRGHWGIEVKVHWVRDVVFDEDRHQNRTGAGPQVMASLRNLALSLLRLDGCDNVAKALRHNGRDYERPLELLLAC